MTVAARKPRPLTAEQRDRVEALYLQYHPLVRKIVGRFCRRDATLDRQELDLEGFEALVSAARGYDPSRINPDSGRSYSFGAYLGRAVHNALVNYQRRLGRDGRVYSLVTDGSVPDGSDESDLLAVPCPSLTERESEEVWAIAERVLSHREYWILRRIYLEGMPFSAAGRAMGVSKERAWTLHQSAVEKLRPVLAEFVSDE